MAPWLWLWLGLWATTHRGSVALTVDLPSNGEQKCFYDAARKGTATEAAYRVIGSHYDDNVPPIDAEVSCRHAAPLPLSDPPRPCTR
jgi:hypothetical protein